MRYSVSNTAEYGDLTVGPRVVNEEVKRRMQSVLEEVQNGVFAREWVLENQTGRPVFNALAARDRQHQIETIGEQLRSMMPWLSKR